ncbi:MBL fold metallo-hydrolase [Chloroflexota bacterium]
MNCYLIKTGSDYVLIDSSWSNKRASLEKELMSVGCKIDNLKLIVLTHGDFDHSGNAAFIRKKYGAKIAMHFNDSRMVKHGDMFWNRRRSNIIIKVIAGLFLRKSDRFEPDIYINDGHDLSEYGFNAKVVHIPEHSKGSVGVLTTSGDLFCGDLLVNKGKPSFNTIIDDPAEANSSLNKLRQLNIGTVYPGHGKPFSMKMLEE